MATQETPETQQLENGVVGDGVDGTHHENEVIQTENNPTDPTDILPFTTDEDMAEIRDKDKHV